MDNEPETIQMTTMNIDDSTKVEFITSNIRYQVDRQDEIKESLRHYLENPNYIIVKLNTMYEDGYLQAAEIHFREKNKNNQK